MIRHDPGIDARPLSSGGALCIRLDVVGSDETVLEARDHDDLLLTRFVSCDVNGMAAAEFALKKANLLGPQRMRVPDLWWAVEGRDRVALRVGARTGWSMGYMGVLEDDLQRITVTGRQEMERDLPEEMFDALDPDADGPGAEADNDLSALTDLPVRLTFDLGECSLTLRELATVGVGYVFDLGLPPRSGVKLRVNGLRVGEGEIVDIDGRLGVAVTRILPPRT